MATSLHGDVASAIGQQVEQMIMQAKKDSEARVRHDLSVARSQLQQMEGIIGELGERVQRCVQSNRPGAPEASDTVDRKLLSEKILQLEQKWGAEVKALKQDLHRTILAHNHNSDLMRHHRDALDEARRKVDAMTQPIAEQVDVQIDKVERILQAGRQKQRALDTITERLGQMELQVTELLPSATMGAAAMGFPGMMAGRGHLDVGMPGADASTGFNAEAPVFVPRAATSSPDVSPAAAEAEEASGSPSGAEAAAKAAAAASATPAGAPPGLETASEQEAEEEATPEETKAPEAAGEEENKGPETEES